MATKVPLVVHSLKFQKRLAMEILQVGQRHVWLNPEKKHDIAKARTRMASLSSQLIDTSGAAVRELIATNVIQLKPGLRGKRTKTDNVKRATHKPLQRILTAHAESTKTWSQE